PAISGPSGPQEEPVRPGAAPALIQVVPAEVLLRPGETAHFKITVFDGRGHALPAPAAAPAWSLAGLAGKLDPSGAFVPDPARGFQTGAVAAAVGELKATARVRVVPDLPWQEHFESIAAGQVPAGWVGGPGKFQVKETADGKVLVKPPAQRGLDRGNLYIGPPTLHDYTVQADLLGTQTGLVRPDMGLVASGYIMDLMGTHQRLQLRAWDTELRFMEQVDFKWEPDRWYTMKLSVETKGEEGVVHAKVWPRGEPEPAAWTLSARDPRPVRHGSPGLYGYSPTDIRFDNLKVT